jgi:hypothetical protein
MASVSKSAAKARLGDVPEEKQFWCYDGRVLKNLGELEAALGQMAEETYSYHSNETKTDFSNWVRDVIGDEKLAKDLLNCSTRAQAAQIVGGRVKWLKTRAGIA